MNLRFLTQAAFDDFAEWPQIDKRVFKRILALIRNIQQTPFAGLGKPEPLKHNLSGYWSRRITGEHRLVYTIIDGDIGIASCKFHYDK